MILDDIGRIYMEDKKIMTTILPDGSKEEVEDKISNALFIFSCPLTSEKSIL